MALQLSLELEEGNNQDNGTNTLYTLPESSPVLSHFDSSQTTNLVSNSYLINYSINLLINYLILILGLTFKSYKFSTTKFTTSNTTWSCFIIWCS